MNAKNGLPQVVNDFISAVNSHDSESLIKTFADNALVKTHLGSFWGKKAIKKYSDDDLITPKVTFTIYEVLEHYGDYMVTALTDGDYDKTKTPDPLYLDYFFTIKDNKILRMFIYLNAEKSTNYGSN